MRVSEISSGRGSSLMRNLKMARRKLTPKIFSTLAINYCSSEIFYFIQFAATSKFRASCGHEESLQTSSSTRERKSALVYPKGYTWQVARLHALGVFNILIKGLDNVWLYLTIAQSISFPLKSSLCTRCLAQY